MRKIILLTAFLFLTMIGVTGFYFSRIRVPGQVTSNLINQIPADAALIFEFNNDREFRELFKENTLLASFIGQKKTAQLHYLQAYLFSGIGLANQDIFISLQPKNLDMLLTVSSFKIKDLSTYFNQKNFSADTKITTKTYGNKVIYGIIFPAIKEAFYLSSKADILTGSFNKDLLVSFLNTDRGPEKPVFQPLTDQQHKNSLANLYVNYAQFPALFAQLFRKQNPYFFDILNTFPAQAVLSLNYKTDALLFNGYTKTDTGSHNYFQLFLNQTPVINSLKAVYPKNTALAMNFAFEKNAFFNSLGHWQNSGFRQSKTLFNQIKTETGVAIQDAFRKEISNEFAVITTAENEKLAMIKLKNGSELEPFLRNISLNPEQNQNQIKYQNLFFYLLGEPFLPFKQPYFIVIDNYLFLSDTKTGLNNYLKRYHQQAFLNRDKPYLAFDELLAAQSNISFFIHFQNANRIIQNTLQPGLKGILKQENINCDQYYALSAQFAGNGGSFYTNLYLQQNKTNTN